MVADIGKHVSDFTGLEIEPGFPTPVYIERARPAFDHLAEYTLGTKTNRIT